MSAIEQCRSAALGGHVLRCEGCRHRRDRLQLVPQPALPEVPGRRRTTLAPGAPGRSAAGGVLPRGLHAAGADRRHRLPEQGRDLRPAVRRGRRDAADHRRRPEAPGRTHRRDAGAAHLGLGADASPARARHRPRRRAVAGRRALGRVQARLLPLRACAVEAVPAALPRRAPGGPSARAAAVLRRARRAGRRQRLRTVARAAAPVRVGRLCQAPVRRTRGGAGLSVALHAPRRHRQQPARRDGRARRHLPLEGLPRQGQARATRR